ncbi:hypothetical protein [Hymenobacter negativus]|uniref:Uncharacterized protein n=1 Tax=Hymenobacter negativus TaxID=2795026 RepID=A0ABS0Q8L1_9BACT|nr:hypothetical protein [Hymenobacter negativus]MBH8558998.1 hypothetical protein [Hymenobacter negativus]
MADIQKRPATGNKSTAGPKRIYEPHGHFRDSYGASHRYAGVSAKASHTTPSYPSDIFDSRADYDAAMRGVAARIASGEIRRKKPH